MANISPAQIDHLIGWVSNIEFYARKRFSYEGIEESAKMLREYIERNIM